MKIPFKILNFNEWLDNIKRKHNVLGSIKQFWKDLEINLKTFDWFYLMSDDSRIWANGDEFKRQLKNMLKIALILNKPKTKELLNKYHKNECGFDLFEELGV